MRWFHLVIALMCFAASQEAWAHEVRPASLRIVESAAAPGQATQIEAVWKVPRVGDRVLGLHPRWPEEWVSRAPALREQTDDAVVERRTMACPAGAMVGQRVTIDGLATTMTDVLVRIEFRDGRSQTQLVKPASPWFVVAGPRPLGGLLGEYGAHGVSHILFGADHMLFVLGLLILVRGRWMLLKTITAFTLAHSLTLAAATLGYARIPVEPLNAAIALSILFLGIEIVRMWRGQSSLTLRQPWLAAFAFGLLHGFGFAGALSGAGLPRGELMLALLAFNVGVELGQVGLVALILLLHRSFSQLEIRWPLLLARAPGYAVGILGAFWTIERTAVVLGVSA